MTITTWSNISDEEADSFNRAAAPTNGPTSRVIIGHISSLPGQPVIQHGLTRVTESDIANSNGSVLSSAQNNGGFQTTKITPESTVEIPGLGRTSVKVAERLGYLSRSADGRYTEGTQQGNAGKLTEGAAQDSDNKQGQNTPEGLDLFTPKMEEAYAELIADIPQGAYDSVVGSATALLHNGGDIDSISTTLGNRLAAAMGIEPGQAAGMVKSGARAWQQQADATVKALGADPEAFWDWATEYRKDELQRAVMQHLNARNTKEYKALVSEYFLDTLPTDEALRKGGIPTGNNGGTRMVKLKGTWMSLESAVKARLI